VAAVAGLVVVLDQVRVMLEVKLMQGLEVVVVVPAHRNMEGLGLALDLAWGLALVLRIGVMGIWYLRGSLVPGEVAAVAAVVMLEIVITPVVMVLVVVLDPALVRQL
jgi:hypothetical protein